MEKTVSPAWQCLLVAGEICLGVGDHALAGEMVMSFAWWQVWAKLFVLLETLVERTMR